MRRLRVRSNIDRFATASHPDVELEHHTLGTGADLRSIAREYQAAQEQDDVVVVNADSRHLLGFCLLSLVMPRRFKLVSLDIVLGPPRTAKARLLVRLRRLLLRQVDHFILYQHDLSGYERHYGISSRRSTYVPFKANVWELVERGELAVRDEGYLLFVGRTYRDVPTFVRACAISGVPAMMVRHSNALAREHGTEFTDGERPPNLRELVHDADRESWMDIVTRARAIVLAIQPGTINAAGISTLLDGLAMGTPVIISHCPATAGIVTEREVALVPWGDAQALADAMKRVHEDAAYRAELIANGKRLAATFQGEARLYRDVLGVLAKQV
jgi:glycosyltransferase involved in cell wall biosynthesis